MLEKGRRKKTIVYFAILAVFVIAGIAFSYYSSEDYYLNRFFSSTYDVEIEEEFYNAWGDKKVYFKNTEETNTQVVLRMNYNEYFKTKDNSYLSNNINGTNIVNKTWTSTYTNDFVYGNDGWYYYEKVLDSQEQIQVLESIALNNTLVDSSPLKNDYYKGNYHLDFNFESVQAKSSAILEVWGKNATISGGNVTWA